MKQLKLDFPFSAINSHHIDWAEYVQNKNDVLLEVGDWFFYRYMFGDGSFIFYLAHTPCMWLGSEWLFDSGVNIACGMGCGSKLPRKIWKLAAELRRNEQLRLHP